MVEDHPATDGPTEFGSVGPVPHHRPDPHTREAYDARPQPADHRPKGSGKKKRKKAARDHAERRENARPLPSFIDIPYDGVTYTIARADAINVETYELIEDGKYVTAVRAWLRPVQWTQFKEAHRDTDGTVPMDALEGFLNTVLRRVRSLGNSPASSGS